MGITMLQHRQPSRIFMEKNSCCVFGGISLVSCITHLYCELLKPNKTITGTLYRTQFMRLSRALKEKRAHYYSRHDKIIILLHNNARPHVATPKPTYNRNTQMGSSTPPAAIHQTAPFDYHLFRSMMHVIACLSSISHYMKISKIVSMIG